MDEFALALERAACVSLPLPLWIFFDALGPHDTI